MSAKDAVILVAIAAGLAIAVELVLRVALRFRGRYYVWQPGRRLELHLDRASHPRLEPVVRFEINEAGERGPAPPARGEAAYRVLATGGSTVESFLLNHESSWPGALQRHLSSPEALARLGAPRVHVGNIGKSGVGAAALDVILGRVLPRYRRVDLLIIMVAASDVILWLETAGTVVPEASAYDYFVWHPEGPFGFTPRRTALGEMLRRARDRHQARGIERRENVAKWIGNARAMRANPAEVRNEIPDPTPMLDSFDRHFRRALQHARAHADRVLVVHQPWFEKDAFTPEERALLWNGGVGKAVYQQVSVFYSDAVIFRLMRAIRNVAGRACDETGVEQIDLMPTLERSVNTYYDHFHHTPVGAAAIARAIADQVLGGAAGRDQGAPGASTSAASLTVANVSGANATNPSMYDSIEA
jgi:lysophospholipase L1-like esterase